MKTRILNFDFLAFVAVVCFAPVVAVAVAASESELAEAARWTAAKFGDAPARERVPWTPLQLRGDGSHPCQTRFKLLYFAYASLFPACPR